MDFFQIKIENIYLFKLIKKTWKHLWKLALPKFSLAAQKIWVAQNLGGGCSPPRPPARTLMYLILYYLDISYRIATGVIMVYYQQLSVRARYHQR